VSLYPFEATVARPGVTLDEAIDNIDIGGPSMIRGAAKNHASVAVVTDPGQYAPVLEELRARAGMLSADTRYRLAAEAFRRTAEYDAAIAVYLREPRATGDHVAESAPAAGRFPQRLSLEASLVEGLRYGENPHQAAAFYRLAGQSLGLGAATQLHGPEPGYNNLLDWSAALGLLLEFDEPAAVVIKHTNPCGVALGRTVGEAMRRAKAADPVSIYGGIVGVNRRLDLEVVKELSGTLLEILFAPAYAPDALEELKRTKKRCRVFSFLRRRQYRGRREEVRSVIGIAAQDADQSDLDPAALSVVSRRPPPRRR
jgi:phosphoribosylaminoimidazolecarboxamide formyltransferase/IMP cyclohydrolase